ncbi:MAG TPA: hypothetical protein VGD94_18910 [Vicinamibacterales bacterium]
MGRAPGFSTRRTAAINGESGDSGDGDPAMARVNQRAVDAIRLALQRFPGLSAEGLPILDRNYAPLDPWVNYTQAQVHTAMDYLRVEQASCKRNKTLGSYTLKHRAERHVEECFRREIDTATLYVSNGAMIAAAIGLGFKVEPNDPGRSLNAMITVPKAVQ